MKKHLYLVVILSLFCLSGNVLKAQKNNLSSLSIEQIMQGSDFIGNLPNYIEWADDGKAFYFYWNPEKAFSDSLYVYNTEKLLL